MLRSLLFLTVAVLLAATGAASAAHGLIAEEVGHQMAVPEEAHPPASSVADRRDAMGGAGGGCLVDAALAAGRPVRPSPISGMDLASVASVMSRGVAASVPTRPPKV
jgi:hypothetical protein